MKNNKNENYFAEKENSFEEIICDIQEYVSEIYEKSNLTREVIESLNEHNETILEYVEELAKEENLSQEELNDVKLAAVLHDVAKVDTPLLKHGFEGAKIAQKKLLEIGLDYDTVEKITNAIERHMGPIPGFIQKEAEKHLNETGEEIIFPRPETVVDKILYDADMLSLMDERGINKILILRKSIEAFIKEDQETANKNGITQEEASWLSALKSAEEAVSSLYTSTARKKGNILIKEARDLYSDRFGKR